MLPKVTCHIQSSVDGRIDWLKPDNFMYYRILAERKFDAVLSSSATMLAAELSPTENTGKYSDQYLIVVDGRGRIGDWEGIKRQPHWNDTPIALCSRSTPENMFGA